MYAFRLCVVNDLRRGLQSVESFQTRLAALPHDRGYPLLLAGQQDRLPRDGHRPNFTSELHSGRKAMNDGIILRTSPEFTALRKNLLQAIERLDGLLAELRPSIRSETYLTSEEVRMIFDLCPRSLQNYRDRRQEGGGQIVLLLVISGYDVWNRRVRSRKSCPFRNPAGSDICAGNADTFRRTTSVWLRP